MDVQEFKRILTAFADTAADVDLSKGKLVAELRNDLIEAELRQKNGQLLVSENGQESPAEKWLINRVACLPLLADRIASILSTSERSMTSLSSHRVGHCVTNSSTRRKMKMNLPRMPLRLFRLFLRSTVIGENKVRQSLGSSSYHFFNRLLPMLTDAHVIRELQNRGSGNLRRFRLDVQLRLLHEALRAPNGRFKRFVDEVKTRRDAPVK